MTCHFDRVDITTCLSTVICQLDVWNKMGLRTLKMLGFPCQDFRFRILRRKSLMHVRLEM